MYKKYKIGHIYSIGGYLINFRRIIYNIRVVIPNGT